VDLYHPEPEDTTTMKKLFAITALFALSSAALSVSCGPGLMSTVSMKCGESQVSTFSEHKCVVVTDSDGDCALKVTVQCPGESEKSTTIASGGKTGRLCCGNSLGRVTFQAVGDSGSCKFSYGRE
jgi:hypothetical protein